MSVASVVPSPVSVVPADISLDDPRLTSELQHENPDGDAYDRKKKVQHGLCYDSEGKLRVKPEIEQSLSPERLRIANALLEAGDAAKANSFLACNLLQKIRGVHIDEVSGEWHDVYITSTACDMPFVCAPCASPKSRVRRFRHDYPYLFQHLRRSAFHVLTFTLADASSDDPVVVQAQHARGIKKVKQFTEWVDGDRPKSESGWKLLHAISQTTKLYAIYQGPKLPAWPTINVKWQEFAGVDATIRCKLFDGKDDDDQLDGLYLAFSGFADYHVLSPRKDLVPMANGLCRLRYLSNLWII